MPGKPADAPRPMAPPRARRWILILALTCGCSFSGNHEARPVGAPCEWNVQCESRLCFADDLAGEPTGWRDGMCVSVCAPGCDSDQTCVALEELAICLPTCADPSGCREGYVCHATLEACLPDCREGWDCGPAFTCDPASGACELVALEGAAFGSPCLEDRECASLICLSEQDPNGADTGWTDGLCATNCATAPCADEGVCVRLGSYLLCIPGCGGNDACREGYVCQSEVDACLPDCRDGWPCGDGFTCDPTEGTCALAMSILSEVGAPCEDDAGCASGVCAAPEDSAGPTGWTAGTCIAPCGSEACAATATACVVLEGEAWCVAACGACREGYLCQDELNACLPDCRLGWTCGDDFLCDLATGLCEPALTSLGVVGAPCAGDAECESGVCSESTDGDGPTGWTDGMCIAPCFSLYCTTSETTCVVLEGEAWCVAACGACRAGYLCQEILDACLPDCRLGWTCGDGFSCDPATGLCAPTLPDLGPVGAPCETDADCGSGVCAEATDDDGPTGWTEGMCIAPCFSQHCSVADTACVVLDGDAWCVAACGACRPGYLCQEALDACLPDCRLGWACGEGFLCEATTGLCAPALPDLGPVGDPCEADADCSSGICTEAIDEDGPTGWTDGMCIAPCFSEFCPPDAGCVVLSGASWCLPGCGDCRPGYLCQTELQICLPDCRLGWDCGEGFVCETSTGACVVDLPQVLPVGSPCALDALCESGVCAEATDEGGATGWTDGMCIAPCLSALCGPDTGCAVLEGQSWCLPTCGTCRDGYVCSTDLQICLPDCRLGWDCGESFLCDALTGECQPDWPTLAGLGEPCTSHSDCESGVCILQSADPTSTWTSGVCTTSCDGGCESGFVCLSPGGLSYCFPICAGQSDCELAYVCDSILGACIPSCQYGWNCELDQLCNNAGLCRGH